MLGAQLLVIGTVRTMENLLDAADVSAVLVACGPVVVAADDVVDPRAFKHREHPLDRHAAAFSSVTGRDDLAWVLRDKAWADLVSRHFLPAADVSVRLAEGAYNAAYARFVDGLSNNEDALRGVSVVVPAEAVATAFLAAADNAMESADTASCVPTRQSAISEGLTALVGRRVEVAFLGPIESLTGRMLASHDTNLVLETGETVSVIPLTAVAYVSTWQLTEDEDQAVFS